MEVRTETEIAAPAAAVWKILTDFSRYPEWNPFLVHIEGELQPGSRLLVTMSLPESAKEYRFKPRLIRCETNVELRWLGHLGIKGLFDGEHFFRLEDRGERTRFIHGEDFSGLFVRFAMQTITQATRGFVYMNDALKRRAESLNETA